jgi:hypothetical protein
VNYKIAARIGVTTKTFANGFSKPNSTAIERLQLLIQLAKPGCGDLRRNFQRQLYFKPTEAFDEALHVSSSTNSIA